MKSSAVIRRVCAIVITVAASLVLLAAGATAANADPGYPPSTPFTPTSTSRTSCVPGPGGSSSAGGANVGGQSNACGIDDRNKHRTNNKQTRTANTGFATLTASVIAAVLLAGGIAFVVAGRKRRHS